MYKNGVVNVYHKKEKSKSSWIYIDEENRIEDSNLFSLEQKVRNLNLTWIIQNEVRYEENISKDWNEKDNFCLFDDVAIHVN